jgi:hypothetical protein
MIYYYLDNILILGKLKSNRSKIVSHFVRCHRGISFSIRYSFWYCYSLVKLKKSGRRYILERCE